MTKRIFIIFIAAVVFINSFAVGIVPIFAHDIMLNVAYDDCSEAGLDRDDPNVTYVPEDGINETWYSLIRYSECRHIGNETNTIKYYFEEIPDDDEIWNKGYTKSDIEEIKTAYANSMKKWNNVYYYSYNPDGTITKKKIINIIEGDSSEQGHNLTISFYYDDNPEGHNIASTGARGSATQIKNGAVEHNHYSKWAMSVNVHCFKYGSSVDAIKERNGAHEFGHILGLRDVDGICDGDDHHEEILMGYGSPMSARSSDITYKDIAGVAITRGFHTDANHKWLNAGLQSDGTYKLICSICNGVKYVSSLSGYTYDIFGECNGNHAPHSNNLMAVASYGNKDYYKCKYCRYVAPFSGIISQNYSAVPVAGGTNHMCTNTVPGLSYSFLEEHEWVDGECSVCGYEHPHTWVSGVCSGCDYEHPHTWEEGRCTGCGYVHPHMLINGVCAGCGFEHDHDFLYMYRNGNYHFTRCDCGYNKLEPHFIRSSQIVDGRYANCLGCGRRLDLWKDSANVQPTATSKFSVNGSYILPNGIVVLVDEDIEAYMNGTLVFYNRDDIPTVE